MLPRHPPNALIALDLIRKKKDRASLLRLLRPSAGPTKLLPSKHVSIPATAIAVTWLVYLTWTTPSLVLRPLHPHLGAANNAVILSERCKCSSKLRASDWTGQVSQKLSGQIGIWWSLPVGQGRQNAKNPSGSAMSAKRIWWSLTESNRRHPACKAGALPTELRPLKPDGGSRWTRTIDLTLIRRVL